ncbi:tail length tape measure protein [Pseudomonas phage NV1]|uniref:Uncharacterized protein n=1 Tax=Pseudomonas phage NV1 TaxID=2079543 RepID=A0A2L0HPM6_9CAUD|nr:tail length tape measure protein [Pseudomonas phage NV1]AUX83660.1 hypothetical protein NV1_p31 [Pseudomonas phage NV1]
MNMEELILLIDETRANEGATTAKVLEFLQNKDNPLKERGIVLANAGAYASSEVYYCGPDGHRDKVSLYDDFYWERHETRTFGEILETTIEHYLELHEDLDVDYDLVVETDGFWNWVATSEDAKALVILDFVENALAEATHDW